MNHHFFCQKMLAKVMEDVREHVPAEDIKKAWAWRGTWDMEFHGPGGFYVTGKHCCLWMMRYKAWSLYLGQVVGLKDYQIGGE